MNLPSDVSIAIANVREMLQDIKKTLCDYTIMKDNSTNDRVDTCETATCDLSEDIEMRLADIENALCELSE